MIERQTVPAEKTDWVVFRKEMPVARHWAYFDHAAVAPLSGPAQRAIAHWSEDAAANGDANYQAWMRQLERSPAAVGPIDPRPARGDRPGPQYDRGNHLVAEGYPWKGGDNVVLPDNEFPSNQYPWLNLISRGVEIRRVPTEGGLVPLEALAQSLRRPHADRQCQLGRLCQRLAAGPGPACRNGPRPGSAVVPGCHPRAGCFSLGRPPHADRLPGCRRPQVAAGAGRGRDFLSPPRAPRSASPVGRRLEQRGPRPRFHPHRAGLQAYRRALRGRIDEHGRLHRPERQPGIPAPLRPGGDRANGCWRSPTWPAVGCPPRGRSSTASAAATAAAASFPSACRAATRMPSASSVSSGRSCSVAGQGDCGSVRTPTTTQSDIDRLIEALRVERDE